jgi:hypothetical protein
MTDGKTARQDRPGEGNEVLLNTGDATVTSNRIVVLPSRSGYACAALGDGARLVRRAFDRAPDHEDVALEKAARDANVRVRMPVGAESDAALRRLALLVAFAKDGNYDPAQPRDERGRWTAGATAAVATDAGAIGTPSSRVSAPPRSGR